ncbi:hypothetical protein GA702_09800, partial [Liquorilactobacillus mali]|nr:hypothetical protein [Liquorilactobacillus mali]
HSWGMPPVMFSVVTKYHKGRHSLFLYNSEIFYAFTQDILRSLAFWIVTIIHIAIIMTIVLYYYEKANKKLLFQYFFIHFTKNTITRALQTNLFS